MRRCEVCNVFLKEFTNLGTAVILICPMCGRRYIFYKEDTNGKTRKKIKDNYLPGGRRV